MITIQGLAGKSKIMLEKMKEDLDSHDIILVDTVGIPMLDDEAYNGTTGKIYTYSLQDFDSLEFLEKTLGEYLGVEEAKNVKRIYLSLNASTVLVTQFYLMEQRLGVEIVVTIQMDNKNIVIGNHPPLNYFTHAFPDLEATFETIEEEKVSKPIDNSKAVSLIGTVWAIKINDKLTKTLMVTGANMTSVIMADGRKVHVSRLEKEWEQIK